MTNDLQDLYRRSRASTFGITSEEFGRILVEAGRTCLSSDAGETERYAFYQELHLEDLVLARACVAGHQDAWEALVTRYRHKLFVMALGIAKDECAARELADSLFAELFGIREQKNGKSSSKLLYYTGRASIEGWMRALLAQAYVNGFRLQRRFVSVANAEGQIGSPNIQQPPAELEQSTSVSPVLAEALDAALAEISEEQRFLLAAHYLDGHSLAELGRMLLRHETTVGRRIDKTLRIVRKRTLHHLRCLGLDMAAAEEALHCDVRDLRLDVRSRLLVAREA